VASLARWASVASLARSEVAHFFDRLEGGLYAEGVEHRSPGSAAVTPRHPGNATTTIACTLKGCHKVAPACATLSALSGIIAP
jgi:hypothetical protein